MILTFELDKLSIQNVYFSETRKNMVMDGKFTKITCSDNEIVTNGIFTTLALTDYIFDKTNNRLSMKDTHKNQTIIDSVNNFEHYILEYYKHVTQTNKKMIHSLKQQMDSHCLKIYRENYSRGYNYSHNAYDGQIILKMSGIWEDDTNFGMTYKIMEAFSSV